MKILHKISLIGAASGWGAQNKNTEAGPLFFEKNFSEFQESLREKYINVHWEKTIRSLKMFSEYQEDLTFLEREEQILDVSKKLSMQVVNTINCGAFPIIIGGDHSLAIGTWNGIAKAYNCYERLGLIWVDAHMDSHTPHTSTSQAIHGMPLALLAGNGSSRIIRKLFTSKKIINPQHLVLIGIRSFEPEEKIFLSNAGAKIYYMENIIEHGLKRVFVDALNYLLTYTDLIGLSIDLDAFDPLHISATGCYVPGGILPDDFLEAISQINLLNTFTAIEIMEFNPYLDKNSKSINFIKKLIQLCATPSL